MYENTLSTWARLSATYMPSKAVPCTPEARSDRLIQVSTTSVSRDRMCVSARPSSLTNRSISRMADVSTSSVISGATRDRFRLANSIA